MRLALGMLVAAMLPAVTLAQSSGAIVATPLPPPTVLTPAPMPDQAPQEQPPADQPQAVTPPPPDAQPAAPQTTEQAAPQNPAPLPSTPQPMQLTWQPQGSAQLQVLDKVNALSTVLNVKVGQQGQYGSLTIQVKACDTHPSDQPQDSAAYLTITDGHADAPGFQGWMLANEPSASMLQNPIYDVRVVGCQT